MTEDLLTLTSGIVIAHVSHNAVASADVPRLIRSVYDALAKTREPIALAEMVQEPAVSVRSSIKPDYLVCLEDGKKLTLLKRYLQTTYGMSPEDYRAKWNLPRDYPMVAPNHAKKRRSLAMAIGLGRKRTDMAGAAEKAAAVVEGVEAAASTAAEPVMAAAGKARKRLGIVAAKAAAAAHLGGHATSTEMRTRTRKPRTIKAR